jgi:hypothetical protein
MLKMKCLSLVHVSSAIYAIAQRSHSLNYKCAGVMGAVGFIRVLLADGADVHARDDRALK